MIKVNDLLEYRNKIIDSFKNGTFSSEHLNKSDDAAHGYVLEGVEKFLQKIKSMSENINPSLFHEFFELWPVDYAKMLINTENPNENKEFVAQRFLITIKMLKNFFGCIKSW